VDGGAGGFLEGAALAAVVEETDEAALRAGEVDEEAVVGLDGGDFTAGFTTGEEGL
jgi:hypothetical protein